MLLSQFDFELPKDLIAQHPQNPRESSRLVHFTDDLVIQDYYFSNIVDIMTSQDVLVFNDTKVIPSFFKVHGINSQRSNVKLNLVRQLDDRKWQIMAKPAAKLSLGDVISFDEDSTFIAKVIEKDVLSNYILIEFQSISKEYFDNIVKFGAMPLPPYIKRASINQSDFQNYQTVFSKNYGALAAPTAGLHFSDQLIQKLSQKGVTILFLTLHVGLGTFSPIKTEYIDDHKMHSEEFSITQEACVAINEAKQAGKKITCVGTTTLRVLESIASNGLIKNIGRGYTDIFIKPGHKFQIADALITNFHLPKSSLLVLISAFVGIENVKRVYSHAIEKKYRFFSYGDACYFNLVRN